MERRAVDAVPCAVKPDPPRRLRHGPVP